MGMNHPCPLHGGAIHWMTCLGPISPKHDREVPTSGLLPRARILALLRLQYWSPIRVVVRRSMPGRGGLKLKDTDTFPTA